MANSGVAQLHHLRIGDPVSRWEAAGFSVSGSVIRLGNTAVVCDPSAGPGIQAISIAGWEGSVAELAVDTDPHPLPEPLDHPNGITRIDHLVVLTTSVEATAQALMAGGLERRRTHSFVVEGQVRRQDFFWLGDVILEVAGPDGPGHHGAASYWGLALESDDLPATVAFLGSQADQPRPAVQKGRLIAGLDTDGLGISTKLAVMSRHRSAESDQTRR